MKHLLILLCSWMLALAQPLPEANAPLPELAQQVLQEANLAASQALATYDVQFIDKPLWQDAIQKGVEARGLAPDHPAPYRFLAEAYGHVNLYDDAWEAWQAYQLRGGTMDARVRQEIAEVGDWLGYNSFSSGDYEGALRYYEVVVSLEPERAEALLNLGVSYFETGNRETALSTLQTLNQTHPNNPQYQEALTRVQNGDSALAQDATNQNNTEQPADQTATQQPVPAQPAQADSAAPGGSGRDASTEFYRGIDLYYSGNIDQAWLAFSAAADADPDYLDAFVWAGRTALELEQPEDAILYWQRATELAPNDEGAAYFLDVAQKQAEWGVDAFTAFEAGYNAYTSGDLAAARTSFADATAANPEYAEAWAWLGRVAFESENFENAYEAYDAARQLEPSVEAYGYFFRESSRRLGRATPQVEAGTQPSEPELGDSEPNVLPPEDTIAEAPELEAPETEEVEAEEAAVPDEAEPEADTEEATVEEADTTEADTTEADTEPGTEEAEAEVELEPAAEAEPEDTQAQAPQEEPGAEADTEEPDTEEAGVEEAEVEADTEEAETEEAETELAETPEPELEEPLSPPEQAEQEPVPQAEAQEATGGPPITVLNMDYSRNQNAVETSGAISFFEPSENLQRDLRKPVNYAGGTLHQSLEVASKPSDEPVQVQVCLIPSDVSVKPACSSGGVRIGGAGSYEANQPLTSFSRYNDLDWSQGIKGIMIILRDENGVPLDLDFALEGGNLELYYPIQLSYEAVLVPAGGTLASQ